MNLSVVLLILIVLLVGMGLLIYDDLDTHQKSSELNALILQDQNTITALKGQVSDDATTNAELTQQIDQLDQQISDLKNEVALLTDARDSSQANAGSPAQAASISQPSAPSGEAPEFMGTLKNWAFLSPVLLIPFILVTRRITVRRKTLPGYARPLPLLGMAEKTYPATLTKAELDQVISSRLHG